MKSLFLEIYLPFALVFLVLAALFLYVSRQQDASARAFAEDSGRAVARLTEKNSFTSSGMRKDQGFGDIGPTSYTLKYEYVHPDTGKKYQSTASAGKEVWDSMQIGAHYAILFSRSDPTLTSLFDGEDFTDGALLATRLWQFFFLLSLGTFMLGLWLRSK